MERFLEVIILGAASFKAIGLLQWGFADKALELGTLSMSLSKGWISWLVLLFAAACYIALLQLEEKRGEARLKESWKNGEAGCAWFVFSWLLRELCWRLF